MSFKHLGNADVEKFFLPNGMYLQIDYGIIYWEDNKYHPFYTRYSGSCRRSRLLTNQDNIITEVMGNDSNIL